MTVVLQAISLGEKPTIGTIASCALVTWGFTYSFLPIPVTFFDATVPESTTDATRLTGEAPILGMVLGVLAAAMIAIHAILVKSAIKKVEGKTMNLAYWQNALSALALLPGMLISGEIFTLFRTLIGEEQGLSSFLIGSAVTVSGPMGVVLLGVHPRVRGSLVSSFASPGYCPSRSPHLSHTCSPQLCGLSFKLSSEFSSSEM